MQRPLAASATHVAPVAGALLALFAGAASADPEDKKPCLSAQPDDAAKQRLILNEGYSMLRRDAFTISTVKWLLLVKLESDPFDLLVTDLSDWGGRLHGRLKDLPEKFPAVRVDLDPLPVMERRKRLTTGWDKFKDIAPLVGASGAEFERRLLISLTNGMNQERHLVEELAREEPDPVLKKIMQDTRAEMDVFYERGERLLATYFK